MRYFVLILLTSFLLISCDQGKSTISEDGKKTSSKDNELVVSFDDLEIKPRFGGCDAVADPAERKKCADKEMAAFINKHLKYPETARNKGIEGKAVISFIVEVNGSLSEITPMTALGGGCEEEAMRVIQLMNQQKQWWVPGMKDGKRVRVKLQLPINFRMS
ncbi:MAG: energy transducer TonB [Bacteroidia bacterium]|nr:energy transducer TonB [Bacteroidia bacterium]